MSSGDQLVVSYSGIRGIVGTALTEQVAARFAHAFRQLLTSHGQPARVVIGNDPRPSSPMLKKAALFGLSRSPCELVDIGVTPTGTVQFYLKRVTAGGGLIITASHNPIEWNGFKFLIGPDQIVLDGKQTKELFRLYEACALDYDPAAPAPAAQDRQQEALDQHREAVVQQVDADLIRGRGFKVVLDSAMGAGSEVTRDLLQQLGCTVHRIEVERHSEPIAPHLTELCRAVKAERADMGFAQDLDADRLAIVDDQGVAIGEEYTLAFAVHHLLEKHAKEHPVVVKNSSTSKMIDDAVAKHGAQLEVTHVGEVNLSKAVIRFEREGRLVFGGEGNGGVIFPAISHGRDSLIGIGLVLEFFARHRASVSAVVAELPRYHILKEKVEGAPENEIGAALQRVAASAPDEQISHFDGIRVNYRDGSWAQVRASNTEPIVRIVAEAPSLERVQGIVAALQHAVAPQG